MRLSEIFSQASGPRISFEVFPPRSAQAEKSLDEILPELVALEPAYMTVTYGAMGSTREKTVEIAGRIRRRFGLDTACHLTCVGSTAADIDAILDRIRDAGIENIVALRGDPPRGETTFTPPPGGYSHAIELVGHIRKRGGFGIAVAGYPEKHIEAPDMESDLCHLAAKVRAGADIVITQLFYDNADFFRFAAQVRAAGIAVPLVPGLLPILSGQQVRRITSMCGARVPQELGAELDAAGDDAERAYEVGVSWATRQARELLQRGVPGIHFYVLNRSSHIVRILSSLRAEGLC